MFTTTFTEAVQNVRMFTLTMRDLVQQDLNVCMYTVTPQERLFIGTPGSYYWQGQTYSQNLWNRLDLVATEEGPESEDNTYLGYSLALGHFDGDGHPDLAVGMPRGANLTGKVIFLTGRTMGQLHNLTGSQVGAYFGHAVAVCDVNGDGLDDVVIGAPMHTDFSLSGGRYETGRVYVVYQNREVSEYT
jgi:hypothetical protein